MKKIILGTAGHIDHGKTTLMKVLTGVDLDRLKVEKQRGITIELGFTSLNLPGGQKIGIIDVPGHEKFIKNMVAGVGGIDIVLMVIAADEGVMPQTREHLNICQLLNIKKGLVALTKIDLVDQEWIALVQEDIRGVTNGTFLEGAPIIPLSSVTEQGLKDLLSALETLVTNIDDRPSSGIFRLPIDRVFTMRGFGTVITGTLIAGRIAVGEEVEILPAGHKAKVRGIQVHNESVTSVPAGLRTAINLQGVEKSTVVRGDVLTIPETALPTRRIDGWLEYLPVAPRPLKHRSKIRFHVGTSEILGEVLLLRSEEILPGKGDFIQLVLEKPVVVFPHDRYVLRSYSPMGTVGGGEILDNLPGRHKRFADDVIRRLEILKQGNTQQSLLLFCQEAGPRGLTFSQIQAHLGLEQAKQKALIEQMVSRGQILAFNKDPLQITLPDCVKELEKYIIKTLKDFHAQNPLKMGLLKEELKGRLPRDTNPKLFGFAVEKLAQVKKLHMSKEFLCLPDHKPVLKDRQKDLQKKILDLYHKGGISPPTRKEVLETLKVPEGEVLNLLKLLMQTGAVVKINDDLYYDNEFLTSIKATVTAHLEKKSEITAQEFRELTGLSRKFLIPLLEYFDKTKLTMRIGDKRILRREKGM
jgi:selenocysteine-specific elongation factor